MTTSFPTVDVASPRASREAIPTSITLPAAPPPAGIVALAEPAARARVTRGLVDLGRPIVTACSGVELVERLADAILDDDESRRPSLIVADAILPGCTGLGVLGGIRGLGWRTPVILAVASGDHRSRREARQLGATGVFCEPYDVGALVALARLALDHVLPASPRQHLGPARSRLIH